tara:strand:+ start:636 stop:2093 length:1458 start_codon:yes stop_codon:yes gene_type:complete
MATSLQLQSSGVTDLRQKFYQLLQEFATFPAAQNFFLVQIHDLPGTVIESNVNSLGIRPGTGYSTGLDSATKQVFRPFFGGGNNWMFLSTGVNLTTETTSVNNKGTLINGLLPVGPFMESREFPDNDLDIQFSETNVSIIDSLFRSWVQLYSVYGNLGDRRLTTDISIYFISKQNDNPFDSEPLITKIYTYKDCIPYVIKDANVSEYDGDTKLGSIAVGWRFSKYDVRIPVAGSKPDPFSAYENLPKEYELPYLGEKQAVIKPEEPAPQLPLIPTEPKKIFSPIGDEDLTLEEIQKKQKLTKEDMKQASATARKTPFIGRPEFDPLAKQPEPMFPGLPEPDPTADQNTTGTFPGAPPIGGPIKPLVDPKQEERIQKSLESIQNKKDNKAIIDLLKKQPDFQSYKSQKDIAVAERTAAETNRLFNESIQRNKKRIEDKGKDMREASATSKKSTIPPITEVPFKPVVDKWTKQYQERQKKKDGEGGD